MSGTVGYRLRSKGNSTAVCTDCAEHIGLHTGAAEEIHNGQYASELCLICGSDITRGGGGGSINYPEEIAVLLDEHFSNVGEQFGGVIPLIDSEYETEEIAEGVTQNKAITTGHDPVVVSLQPHEDNIVAQLQGFADTVSTLGPIRGQMQEFEGDDGETLGYEFAFFAVQ